MKFTYTGITPDTLASGRPVAFGDTVTLTRQETADNVRLIDAGHLAPVATPAKSKKESD